MRFTEGLKSFMLFIMDSMTTTQLKPKQRRKTTTPKTMTESTYTTKVTKSYKHTEPVVIDSHLKDVQVLSTAAYVQDFKNRIHINNVEVKELINAHVEVYEYVKPYVVSTVSTLDNYVKSLRDKPKE